MCCPVLLHNRLAFNNKTGAFGTDTVSVCSECRCRKQIIPMLNDVEYDQMLRLIPSEQMCVVVCIEESKYNNKSMFIILNVFH